MSTAQKRSNVYRALSRVARAALRWTAATETAVVLLAVLVIVLAWATVIEGARGQAAVQQLVYRSWWFVALFGLLGINILAAMLVRYPWNRGQSGFVITHAGLLILLIGMAQTFVGGIEGRMTLQEGAERNYIWLTRRSELKINRLNGETPSQVSIPLSGAPVDVTGRLAATGWYCDSLRVLRVSPAPTTGRSSPTQPADRPVTGSDSMALIEFQSGSETQQVWLERNGAARTVATARGPWSVRFSGQRLPLGFSLRLLEFVRTKNAGGYGDASFVSRVRLQNGGADEGDELEVTMNQPLVHAGFQFSQVDFYRLDNGKTAVILSVVRDPGRALKYLGAAVVCLGTMLTFFRRVPHCADPAAPRVDSAAPRTGSRGMTGER